ncbi:hypothetical protein M9H77_05133 [Catharanthus roseus]|uniref:Uncharacterized protein n=1 Tax=Catharanthus roseus TaxID=4058 RepID=A0ACC0CG67_CATRO|nr:hypothetical protein M9H77_05133 [Catharanthus roseus]
MGVQLAADSNLAELGNVNLSDSELVYHVRSALKAALEGDTDGYHQLVGVMHHNERLLPEEVALLVTCLKSLSGAVSCINAIHHGSLLAAIFGMSLWNYSSDVMDALVELLTSLAGSNGQFVDLCLDMLVSNFTPPFTFMEALKKPFGLRRKDQVLDHVHSTLKNIADLVPLSPLRLEKIIKDRMPNIYTKEPLIVMYVENMLRLESSAIGELVGSTMLVAIIDRLIDLDVEIHWDDILRDDFGKGIFEMELEDLEGPAGDPLQDVDERQIWLEQLFGENLVAPKLDSLMVLTFEHLKSSHESGRLHQAFETLLQSFQKTVLTAYKSKFAQFVIFYACSLDPDYCGTRFADTLINIFENSNYPEWRMSAVAYLASYLSRAKFVSASLVADMLERLVNWCYTYSKNLNEDLNPKAHKVYYAGCQAVMYVLCFRMRAIVAVPRLRSKLFLMQIADILRHKLNPLKVCLPSIVEEFLRLARSARLFSLPDNLAANGMLESDFSVAFGGPERLDMFFPFDPCLLKKSDRFIRPNFVYWSMVRSTYENDDDDEDEGSSDEDVAEFSGRVNRMEIYDDDTYGGIDDEASDHDLDKFDYSLDKMSITPKNLSTRLYGSDLRGAYLQMPSRIRPSTSPESL